MSNPQAKHFLLNQAGFCLMSLGRLREAVPFYERAVADYLEAKAWSFASLGYQNLASLHAYLGALEASADAAVRALDLASRAKDKQGECDSRLFQAWAAHLLGDIKSASGVYLEAEKLQREIQPALRYHFSTDGIKHADHLRRSGQSDYAHRVAEANLQYCKRNHFSNDTSRCYRVLGDLDADASQHTSARTHYDTALKIARSVSYRPALIEALLARGRWAAKYMKDATSAFNDLNEALGYAVDGGYRIYEADIRVALAWAGIVDSGQGSGDSKQVAESSRQKAKDEAERALRMSEEMGYYWGKVDAEKVLKEISKQ